MPMKLMDLYEVGDGKYLHRYELTYENKAGKEKRYEMVSHRHLKDASELGQYVSGVSIAAFCDGKMLLLKEFRLAVNRDVYNLCAGMVDDGETIENCVRRELYEETNLSLVELIDSLPPAFAAVSMSDIKNQIVFVKVAGTIADHTSDNEQIEAKLYSKEEVQALIETEEFSNRAQIIAYMFVKGFFDN